MHAKKQNVVQAAREKIALEIAKASLKLAMLVSGKGESVLPAAANGLNVNLLYWGLKQRGMNNYDDSMELTGENNFIFNELENHVSTKHPVFFDVGANEGGYSRKLSRAFSGAKIFAFEPNHSIFRVLERESKKTGIRAFNVGLSDKEGTEKLFATADKKTSKISSVHKEWLGYFGNGFEARAQKCRMETVDGFCSKNKIKTIDLLKIDTEGSEFKVLLGARGMIAKGRINAIQFEFSEAQVFQKAFLLDYYRLLEGYDFFRLLPAGLLPLGKYDAKNEIFQFQNIVAMRHNY